MMQFMTLTRTRTTQVTTIVAAGTTVAAAETTMAGLNGHMRLALRDLKLAAQGFQLLVALLRPLPLLLLHPMGDVGLHTGLLWSWGEQQQQNQQ